MRNCVSKQSFQRFGKYCFAILKWRTDRSIPEGSSAMFVRDNRLNFNDTYCSPTGREKKNKLQSKNKLKD